MNVYVVRYFTNDGVDSTNGIVGVYSSMERAEEACMDWMGENFPNAIASSFEPEEVKPLGWIFNFYTLTGTIAALCVGEYAVDELP